MNVRVDLSRLTNGDLVTLAVAFIVIFALFGVLLFTQRKYLGFLRRKPQYKIDEERYARLRAEAAENQAAARENLEAAALIVERMRSGRGSHLVLHACCAPCTIKSYERIQAGEACTREGEPVTAGRITLLYYNPNIAPADEYERRRDALLSYCAEAGIEAVELDYEPEAWEQACAADLSAPGRCRQCYALRLGRAAQWAAQHGANALTTTLTISPWQLADLIAEEGKKAAEAAGIRYLDIDFSPDYRASQQAAREAGIYRQKYCGCLPSKREAEEQRAH
ncbi:MAG: epoxyqueuosine reductase QueH [Actinomycetia bacterium]|nr:epoxyqueuosine reductase QueH [Actinomycetes bacterium]